METQPIAGWYNAPVGGRITMRGVTLRHLDTKGLTSMGVSPFSLSQGGLCYNGVTESQGNRPEMAGKCRRNA